MAVRPAKHNSLLVRNVSFVVEEIMELSQISRKRSLSGDLR